MSESEDLKTTVSIFPNTNVWAFHLPVPTDIANKFIDKDRRVIFSINDSEYHGALMPDGSGAFFINLNKEIMKKHQLNQDDEVNINLRKDTTKYGIYTPHFFEELCFQDPEGSDHFHNLTMGKQRSLLHVIGKPKSEQKQLEKALTVFDYLKSSEGELDFKQLNEAFKNSRFKQ